MEEMREYFYIAIRNLRTRSLRSWLTIFGIVIGVFLIISLLSLSEGIKDSITQQLRSLGGETIFVMPGDMSNPLIAMMGSEKLEKADIETIKRTDGVEEVVSMSHASSIMRYEEESKQIILMGVDWEESLIILEGYQGWSLDKGRWPTAGKREIVVGQQVAYEIFEQEIEVDSSVVVKGKTFKIVGIMNSLGSQTDDSGVYVDMVIYGGLTGEKKGSAQMAMVKIEEGVSLDETAENIRENLRKTRKRRAGTDEADFSVITSDTIGDIAGNILAVIQLAIIAFASIAIIVGGIGITNTMFTSVRERTKEIGIMKAIGAKNVAVLSIFLFESAIIGLSGGIGGTLLGVGFAKAIELYGLANPSFYFRASISIGLIVFGLVFSFLIGCLAGFFPAKQAAKLKPVEALRRLE
ncbi:MAG: ABC transporter permease [Patescibacteria group bacterium]|nr:ABC transporter permease [Patescibacteria group bacterium]